MHARVGVIMAMVSEKELQLREKELYVRERDVATREKKDNIESLTSFYDDLIKDLIEAKEDSDIEEIERIKDEMKQIKRRRIDFSNN